MVYLPTWLGDFVRANVGTYSSTMVRIWGIAGWWFQTWLDDVSVWEWSSQLIFYMDLPSGNLLHSYWKWPFIVDFPIKNGGSFHSYVSLPEGNHSHWLVFFRGVGIPPSSKRIWPWIQSFIRLGMKAPPGSPRYWPCFDPYSIDCWRFDICIGFQPYLGWVNEMAT